MNMTSLPLTTLEVRQLATGSVTVWRLVKPQPVFKSPWWILGSLKPFRVGGVAMSIFRTNDDEQLAEALTAMCPWQPGEQVAVKETWAVADGPGGPSDPLYLYFADPCDRIFKDCWRSSTTMPQAAVRYRPTVASVRVKRANEVANSEKWWGGLKAWSGNPLCWVVELRNPTGA